MRKVLLATTALVAMSVTAAQADISIGGSASFEINDSSSNQAYSTDGSIVFKSTSTTDNGLTITAAHDMKFEGGTNDSYIDIAGSFGSFRMGNTDDALDRMDGALPHNWDMEGNLALQANVGGDQSDENISFISPNMGGVTVYGSTTPNGTTNGMGVTYANGPINLVYQSGRVEGGASADDADETMVGASFTMGALKVGAGHNTAETVNSVKTKTNEIGATYTMGDITLVAVQGKTSASKSNSIGVSFAIAPGLSFSAESAEKTGAGANTETYMGLHVSF
jgi:hypothetical protein